MYLSGEKGMSTPAAGMKIMASVGGYGGAGAEPITLTAFKNNALGVLVIMGQIPYTDTRVKDLAFVTNMRLPDYDCLFRDEDLNAAIIAFKEGEGLGTILFDDNAARWRPRIESDGVDSNGQKYRLGGEFTNGEMAVLALSYFMTRQRTVDATSRMTDDIARLYQIMSI